MKGFEEHHKEALKALTGSLNKFGKYLNDPVGYASEVHGVKLYPEQIQVLEALVNGSHRVMCRSGNGVGKTLVAAVAAKWFYDCFDIGECIITGPREESLRDSTFKEIRLLHGDKNGMFPASMRLQSSPNHYIKGTVAKDGTSFQSAHNKNCMIIFEEAVGIPPDIWAAARGILSTGIHTFWLCIHNPTDSACQAYLEEQTGDWDTFAISTFDHPNIKSQLKGGPIIIDSGPTLASLKLNMNSMGTWVKADDASMTDVKFEEPGEPLRWWRPGPDGDGRIMGRYPSQSSYSIFSESDFAIATSTDFQAEADLFFEDIFRQVKEGKSTRAGFPDRFGKDLVPQFGCDVARFGDDRTSIHGRIGRYSFYHQSHNGQDTEWTSNRLKMLCNEWGEKFGITPTKIPVKVDDTGVGGGVTDQRGDYNFIPINAATLALEELNYPNKRSEILFNLALMMRAGDVVFPSNFIDRKTVQEIQRQALSVTYKADSRGRRVAESKDRVKERVRRSPDDLDALGLAYYYAQSYADHKTIDLPMNPLIRPDQSRNLFGDR